MSKSDEIDELVSSVRNFVAHKDAQRAADAGGDARLVLTSDQRLSEEEAAALDAEWEEDLRALEQAGVIPPGKAHEMTLEELEAAVARLPEGWQRGDAPVNGHDNVAWAASAFEQQRKPQPQDETAVFDMDELEDLIAKKISAIIPTDAALRALVVKTVHEELGGELGERITRNVRKLVRREINRVLTSRELDND